MGKTIHILGIIFLFSIGNATTNKKNYTLTTNDDCPFKSLNHSLEFEKVNGLSNSIHLVYRYKQKSEIVFQPHIFIKGYTMMGYSSDSGEKISYDISFSSLACEDFNSCIPRFIEIIIQNFCSGENINEGELLINEEKIVYAKYVD